MACCFLCCRNACPGRYESRWEKVSAVLRGLSGGTISVDPTIRKAMGTAGWGNAGAFARMHKDGIRWDISVWHMCTVKIPNGPSN